jgi:hypothetical protein
LSPSPQDRLFDRLDSGIARVNQRHAGTRLISLWRQSLHVGQLRPKVQRLDRQAVVLQHRELDDIAGLAFERVQERVNAVDCLALDRRHPAGAVEQKADDRPGCGGLFEHPSHPLLLVGDGRRDGTYSHPPILWRITPALVRRPHGRARESRLP